MTTLAQPPNGPPNSPPGAGGDPENAPRIEVDQLAPTSPTESDRTVVISTVSSDATVVIPRVSPDATVIIHTAGLGPRADPGATVVLPQILGHGPQGRSEPVRRRRRPSVDTLLVGALLAVVLTVQGWNITGFPNFSDDEGTYLAQAWAVREGLGLAHYTYWYDHPPLGWIQLAGLSWLPTLFLPDQLAVGAGRVAMLPVIAISMALVYLLSRRLGFARWSAAVAVLAYGLSPLSVTMQRQIYLDSFAVMWMLAAFVLALSPRRHLWHHVAAGAAAGIAVLSKETMLIVVPALLVALWQGTARNGVRSFSFAGFLSGISLVGVIYPLYAILNDELLAGSGHVSLLGALQFQLQGRPGSGSLLTAGSDARQVLDSWLFYDPVLIYAGAVAGLLALAVRRLRPAAVAVTLLVVMALRPSGYLPAMYVIQALPFLAIVLAGLAEVGASRLLQPQPAAPRAAGGARNARRLRIAVVAAATALALTIVVPRWYDGNLRAFTVNDNRHYAAALTWLRTEVPDHVGTTVVTDDVLWLDLVNAGYPRERVIWFYKLDLDRAVAERLTHGWRDVDLVVSTPALRADDNPLPTLDLLLANSEPIATFGAGPDRIEIRQVDKERAG